MGCAPMNVAVLGLGRMGQAIATRLRQQGHDVTVWNRTPGKAQELVVQGAVEARTAAEAAAAVGGDSAVLTMLTDDAAVREVCLGTGGVIAALGPGTVLVDMSTVSPHTSRALGAAVPGGRFVDAPVLAGPHAVRQGQGLHLLGGPPDLVEQLEPLWSSLLARHVYCGPTGSGATMKLLSNLLLIAGAALLSEAVVTAQAHGMSNAFLRDFLRQHPMVPPGLHNRLDDIIEGDHAGWFTVALARKDLQLASDLGAEKGLHLDLAATATRLLAEAQAAGRAEQDLGAVAEIIRETGLAR